MDNASRVRDGYISLGTRGHASLVWRYFRQGGGVAMLRMMNKPMPAPHHAHAH